MPGSAIRLRRPLLALLLASCFVTPTQAATAADAEQAIARATASADEAASLKNQWTTTTQAIADAKKAVAAGDADKAIALARHAEALAKASIAQTRAEEQAWKDAVIR